MKLLLLRFVSIALAPIAAFAGADPRGDHPDAPPSTPEQEKALFHLPPGFEIQLVAAEPEIQKPINITFDGGGRLWVTGSEMYPWPAGTDAQGKPIPNFQKAFDDIASAFHAKDKAPAPSNVARDTVRVLSDFDATGHAGKISIFADGLNIPSGVQPLPRKPGAKGDTVIVYSIPNIYRLEDTEGSGRADKREVLYGSAGFLDTHGGLSSFLYWIDGWIYGTHGFRNHSEMHDKTGRVTVLDSGNTYRFRPDGSAFEIYTHGQTNPFGLTVDPLGNFYSADSHSRPVYMLLRGGFYEGIGKQHDGLGFAPRITDDDHGSTAIGGIAYYAADKFPEEYRGDLFNGNVVTQRINRDKLEWHGSTPKAIRQPDFLTSDDPWFRPVQVKLGPDGALWIADFYNPIIGHYEFPLADPHRDHTHGRIWRVVWRGEKKDTAAPVPDLRPLAADDLVKKLADPNLVVRTLATNEMVDRVNSQYANWLTSERGLHGGQSNAVRDAEKATFEQLERAVKSANNGTARQQAHALWIIERCQLIIPGCVANALVSKESDVRVHAATLARDNPSKLAWSERMEPIRLMVRDSQAAVRRAAVDTIDRQSSPDGEWNIPALLSLLREASIDDSELIHTARMALRDTLIAPSGYSEATKLITTDAQAAEKIADVSLGAKTPEAAEFLLGHLGRTKLQGAHSGEFLRHTVLYLPQEKIGAIAGLIETVKTAPLPQRLNVADNLAQAYRQRGIPLPAAITDWTQHAMIEALAGRDEAQLKRAIESVREAKFDAKLEPLAKIAGDAKQSGPIRLAALEAASNLPASRDLLSATLADPAQMVLRKRAAELLAQNGNIAAVLAALPSAPWELAVSISGGLAKTDVGCAALLDVIEAGKTSPHVLRNNLVAGPLLSRPQPLRDRANALTRNLPPEDGRLDGVIAKRAEEFGKAKPNAAHGSQVFAQNCAVCHRFKNAGANIGPALDGIGARGVHRVIEDILDPNRNVDPMFRQTVVETTDGQTLAGMNSRVEGELLVLTDATGKAISVEKAKVKSQVQSPLSLMPPVFETTIPTNDFNDLLAYLLEVSGKL